MASFSERFKVRKTKGYQQWEEEGESSDYLLMAGGGDDQPPSAILGGGQATRFREDEADCERSLELSSGSGVRGRGIETSGEWVKEVLSECFYLGSYDMAGLSIRGRGCIDYPAGSVWQQTQQDESGASNGGGQKPRRKNSWSPRQKYESRAPPQRSVSSGNEVKPRYVRVVAEREALEIVDDHNGEKVDCFNYRKISFVGTHPKYTRLFAFVAESTGKVFCHAFKCESKEAADKTACGLSDVFQRKIKEIQDAKKQQQTIEITASATVLN